LGSGHGAAADLILPRREGMFEFFLTPTTRNISYQKLQKAEKK
jgi:hypothetical protein